MTALSAKPENSIHPEAKYWRDQFYAIARERDDLWARYKELKLLLMDANWPDLGVSGAPLTILKVLYRRRDTVITKEMLYHALYSDRLNDTPDPKNIDVHICKLRQRLPEAGIKTAWGRGYYLSPEGREWLRKRVEPKECVYESRSVDSEGESARKPYRRAGGHRTWCRTHGWDCPNSGSAG